MDAMEATGQSVQQEPPSELIGASGHGLVEGMPLGTVVLPAEGHAPFVERDEPLARDGHAMRIARKAREYNLGSGERALLIHHPLTRAQRREPPGEDSPIGKCGVLTEEPQLVTAMQDREFLQEAAPEQA
ncbi:hypothetical protein R69749_07226 [Paraburkholderia domus]|uniref:Uncharacterized protein n=1 Tax=Paraburkholderia domus TaxID=2793075 RepID=A0A9N8R5W9_9BURK|nr:hypothetical protein R70006_07221 [Paraburkholderia domus]CAE6884240.1 hypothetical protein R69749_07226 [Paraburkholderia domus]CAE6960026.1 hypothetical protein R70199_07248 [Paraburkholderia domus]CAE6964958.1 hypothetical protein R70211_07266 [Paraburkholderia domus]